MRMPTRPTVVRLPNRVGIYPLLGNVSTVRYIRYATRYSQLDSLDPPFIQSNLPSPSDPATTSQLAFPPAHTSPSELASPSPEPAFPPESRSELEQASPSNTKQTRRRQKLYGPRIVIPSDMRMQQIAQDSKLHKQLKRVETKLEALERQISQNQPKSISEWLDGLVRAVLTSTTGALKSISGPGSLPSNDRQPQQPRGEALKNYLYAAALMGCIQLGPLLKFWLTTHNYLPSSAASVATAVYVAGATVSAVGTVSIPFCLVFPRKAIGQRRFSRKVSAYRDLFENHGHLLDTPFPMKEVLEDLRNLQALYNPTSARSYRIAERRLYRIEHDAGGQPLTLRKIASLLEADNSVAWKVILQRLVDGKVHVLEELSSEEKARMLFCRIYGIGPKKAEKLVQAGYRTFESLSEGPLESAQRIGLRHLSDIESLIPRPESLEWHQRVQKVLKRVDPALDGELLGSFRRGDFFSSDLDWVLYHPEVNSLRDEDGKPVRRAEELLDEVIHVLRKENLLADELLAHGPLAAKGLVRLPGKLARRIDLNFAPYDRRAFYTLAKTGDTGLMIYLREKAKQRGWALNEYGIGPRNENGSAWTENLLNATEERQIFEFLNVPFLEPHERNVASYHAKLGLNRWSP